MNDIKVIIEAVDDRFKITDLIESCMICLDSNEKEIYKSERTIIVCPKSGFNKRNLRHIPSKYLTKTDTIKIEFIKKVGS